MRWTSALLLGVAVSVGAGCGLIKKLKGGGGEDDAGAAAEADAATVTVTGTGASNEAAVTRYEKETPIANEEAVIAISDVKVRTAARSGSVVATLNAGTPVLKMASYFSSGVLIMFDDPATPEPTKFMGWVQPEAFIAPPGTVVSATATLAPLVRPPTPTVKKVDAGAAPVAGKDAGAPAVATVDAGTAPVAKVDAGAAPTPTKPPPTNPAGGLAFPPPPSGKCPAPYQKLDGMCRRPCTNDSGCPRATKCVPARVPGHKYCSLG